MKAKGKYEIYRNFTITVRKDKGYDITCEKYPNVTVYRYTKQQCYWFIDSVIRKDCHFA